MMVINLTSPINKKTSLRNTAIASNLWLQGSISAGEIVGGAGVCRGRGVTCPGRRVTGGRLVGLGGLLVGLPTGGSGPFFQPRI